jgi:hypothetical protein
MGDPTNELHLFLGRVEGKLDAAIASLVALGTHVSETDKTVAKVSERVTIIEAKLESKRGLITILISIAAAAAAIWGNLKGHLQ